MEAEAKPAQKQLIWVGESREMVRGFPETVRGEIGVALYQAQLGGKHAAARPLRGIDPAFWRLSPIIVVIHFVPSIR
jgi:phage-related protein